MVETKQSTLASTDDTITYGDLEKIPSDTSLLALHPGSPVSPQVTTPITPSLTTGTSVTTDDEEGDYQSAYSTSPRGSYGSFENFSAPTEASDSDLGTPTTSIAKEYLVELQPSSRERALSTSTARGTKAHYRDSRDTMVTSSIGSI